jgi:hypothetical protein
MTAVQARTAQGHTVEATTLRAASLLDELLAELAFALLPRGITPKRFSDLVRLAFVRAATDMARLRNGRVNYSRVAAQTGLSRADVKRLLGSNVSDVHRIAYAPTERVVNAWRTDRMFADKYGRPRRLRITGSNASFAGLVRKYGGDVTHRAVLDELRRIGVVRDNGESVSLKVSPALRNRHNFTFLSPVIPVLVDGIRIASERAGLPPSSIQRLTLPVESEVDLAIVRERCSSSAKSMLDGLGESLGTRVTVPRRRRNSQFSFTVTVLMVENRAAKRSLPRVSTGRDR